MTIFYGTVRWNMMWIRICFTINNHIFILSLDIVRSLILKKMSAAYCLRLSGLIVFIELVGGRNRGSLDHEEKMLSWEMVYCFTFQICFAPLSKTFDDSLSMVWRCVGYGRAVFRYGDGSLICDDIEGIYTRLGLFNWLLLSILIFLKLRVGVPLQGSMVI